jgi:hypothetical protein
MTEKLKLIRTGEVARRLTVTPTHVGWLVKQGKLKAAAVLTDGTPLFDPKAVTRLKESQIAKLTQRIETLKSTG